MKPSRLVILPAAVIAFLLSMGEVKSEDFPQKSFEGLVIYLDEDAVQVKRGSKEITFQRSGEAVVEKSPGAEGETGLFICQQVRVWYQIKEGRKLAVKILILRPGYCGP